MATTEPKMRSITGKLTPNKLTERDDDFTCNIVYQANRSIPDLCKFAAAFDQAKKKIVLRNVSLVELKKDLDNMHVIITGASDGLPVITLITNTTTGRALFR